MSVTDTTSTTVTTTETVYTATANANSDIDWDALIEAAVMQKELPADTIEIKMLENEAEIAAYEEMQSLLQDMEDALDTIRGTTNSLTESDDIFSVREAYLTGYGDVTAESAVVVTADDGVDVATYQLEILQLATSQKVAGDIYADSTAELGLSGSFTLELDGAEYEDGESASEISITEDMSLDEIAEEINLLSDTTGVSASVIQVSDTEFQLVLSATETGQDIVLSSTSGDDIGQSLGVTDTSGAFTSELQSSQDAIISVDGIQVTRDSNVIDDVVDGLTFSIYQETSDDDYISVEVAQSLTTIQDAIYTLVDTYNAYREWALTQQEVSSSGGASDDAVLFGDSTMRLANSGIASSLATIIDNEGMSLIGLSYDSSNYLEVDDDTLSDALLTDLDAIEDLLLFNMETSSNDLALLARSDSMPDELSLDIEVDDEGSVTSVLVDGAEGLFEVSGTRIVGVEGSIYDGISFVFTGTESQTVDMTFTSGLAENLYNVVNQYADEDDGVLTEIITTLSDQNTDYEEEYDSIISDADDYRDYLTELYASYQAEIEAAQADIEYLEALLSSGD
ncbi:flagellar filament capping protein FliD [Roseibium polysiphoniae]|uniref:Flagellar hook-associated protein 2 n=1 Tax=Roseibium polysiphoniae TaxID=2571221 RepID=A0ABR9CB99_9HYPH|nr:flagellar filament capping protein FliD [Roseibium polysiphoniae]MBD8877166.1 flagellar filament capping protein FliD [Roseibium polysiphoniae]